MVKRVGNQTILLENTGVLSSAGVVGKKEGEGPLKESFDMIYEDEYLGQETFEAAESMLLKNAINLALEKSAKSADEIDLALSGDLLNQCMASTYGVKDFGFSHIGLFGACSTCALSCGLGALLVETGIANTVLASTSSHFCTAERQFRFPLEYGSKSTPTSQTTVTGAGAFVLSKTENNPKIKAVTFGKVKDFDITDANNMGAAMAPAAADTIKAYFDDTGATPSEFDLILTGDLGKVGSDLLIELLTEKGIDISSVHNDCGTMIFDVNSKDFAAGGSGCGCSASVVSTYIMDKFKKGELSRILFIGTGALLSPTATNQGLSIPSIAHLIEFAL